LLHQITLALFPTAAVAAVLKVNPGSSRRGCRGLANGKAPLFWCYLLLLLLRRRRRLLLLLLWLLLFL
jgi:hypothetical protein